VPLVLTGLYMGQQRRHGGNPPPLRQGMLYTEVLVGFRSRGADPAATGSEYSEPRGIVVVC
jgi:hypothetical protein